MKFAVVIKIHMSHMNRIKKPAILSICQELSVKDMFEKIWTLFGQIVNILP